MCAAGAPARWSAGRGRRSGGAAALGEEQTKLGAGKEKLGVDMIFDEGEEHAAYLPKVSPSLNPAAASAARPLVY